MVIKFKKALYIPHNKFLISHFLLIHIRIYIVRGTIFFANHDMIDS